MWLGRKHLYFFSQGKYIKIGVANNLWKRLGQLQTGNPNTINIYAVFYDMSLYEGNCHKKLHNDKVVRMGSQNEWFYYTERTDKLIEELIRVSDKNSGKYMIDKRFKPMMEE